jgi:hypothetical protein
MAPAGWRIITIDMRTERCALAERSEPPRWQVRPYQEGDERQIVPLFARVFGREITEAHWRWKLGERPSPVANVWLATDQSGPIFQYAGIPVTFQLPTGHTMAMISVDTMTAPEYRRQGLLTTVGRAVYDAWRDAGIGFVLGLPNEQWGSRASALGWEPLFPLRWLVRPLRPATLLARRLRLPSIPPLAAVEHLWNRGWELRAPRDPAIGVRPMQRAGTEIDRLWDRCAPSAGISIVRDSDWVNWRYLAPSTDSYRVLLAERDGEAAGYAAYRVQHTEGRSVGYIAEVLTHRSDRAAEGTLIARCIAELQAAGAELVATLAVPDAPLHQALRRAGFRWGWGEFMVEFVPLDPGMDTSVFHQAERWTISGGDFDVV